MDFLYIKALHIIFIVTWFAGIFYIVRLFIYHTEAQSKSQVEKEILSKQFLLMEKRLWYGITWPSSILTLVFASWMIIQVPEYLRQPFMHVKLSLVFGLYIYHFWLHYIFLNLKKGNFKWSSTKLRIWNEVATLFLVSIVFIIVLKNQLNWIWGVIGFIIFTFFLLIAIRLYKRIRKRNDENSLDQPTNS